ncbi:MAG: ATP-binding cassette domain-containing protein [Acutalibacteraceae bacterium]|nr:ATP-binding cassette domain-containing protein [Acutalibacteraceae bacterium]
MIMIQVENLTKEFKKVVKQPGIVGSVKSLFNPKSEKVLAVDNVSFSVPKGEVLGFIGPNGAGKSTVIKMLTGILTPTSGQCVINGKIPQKDRKNYVREIGVVFGQRTQLWWDLPLLETYSVLKEIYEVPDDKFKKRMDFLNEVLDLNSFIKSPVRTLSLGQRMRADIAASLLHSPKVLFLDEPTIGLDVVVKDNIRKAIAQINAEEETTVILTTHDLSDIELLCQRIVMIDKGKNVFDGNLQELKSKYGQMRELCFETDITENIAERLSYKENFKVADDDIELIPDGNNVKVRFNSNKIAVADMLTYTLNKVNVKDINVKDADIEEIIRRLYKEGVAENA